MATVPKITGLYKKNPVLCKKSLAVSVYQCNNDPTEAITRQTTKGNNMAKQFNIETETSVKADFSFRGAQEEKFEAAKCARVFEWRDLRGDVQRLPDYVRSAIRLAGFKPVYIGGTTFKYSVIGLARI